MKTAKIKCPKCGKESYVIPEDVDKTDLIYHCDQCGSDYEVSFFDHCPKCKVDIGFLEGNSFKKDMYSIGKDMVSFVINPVSIIDSLSPYVKKGIVDSVEEANGDGVCPICNIRYIRCYACHDIFSIKSDAVFKDSFTCPHCGKTQFPGHVKEGREKLHSSVFLSSHREGKTKRCVQSPTINKKNEINTKTSTKISRKEAFKIISFVIHLPVDYINGAQSICPGRSEYKRFKKNGFHIPEKVLYQCRTYNDLADAIIECRERQNTSEKTDKALSSEKKNSIPNGYTLVGYSHDGFPCYGHNEYLGKPFKMTIEEVFYVEGHGCILTGIIE